MSVTLRKDIAARLRRFERESRQIREKIGLIVLQSLNHGTSREEAERWQASMVSTFELGRIGSTSHLLAREQVRDFLMERLNEVFDAVRTTGSVSGLLHALCNIH
jgi:hypothetical protein